MAKKENGELVKKFQKLEAELIEVLKIHPIEFDEGMSKTAVKKEINGYIKKLKKAKAIFDEYEKVAEEIKKASGMQEKLVQKVLELRDESESQDLAKDYVVEDEIVKKTSKTEYENVVEHSPDGVKVSAKKKESKKRAKEL